ncbi:MAG: alpha-ribazole phosphatase [Candidatus Doudnabacteria bacterium]
MIELILIRHTAVEGSRQQRYLGVTDVALNRKGWEQAERISGYLKNKSISTIYSSGLKRAYQTATVIAKPYCLKIRKEEGFNEFDFGSWKEKTFYQIQKKYPNLAQKYLLDPLNTKIPGGESFRKFKNRVNKVLEQILTKEEGTVVIVSHAGVNRIIICSLLNLPSSYLWQIKQDIGAINIIEIYKNMSIISLINHTL